MQPIDTEVWWWGIFQEASILLITVLVSCEKGKMIWKKIENLLGTILCWYRPFIDFQTSK